MNSIPPHTLSIDVYTCAALRRDFNELYVPAVVWSWPALSYSFQNVHKSILKVCKFGQVTIPQCWTLSIVCGILNNFRCHFGNWLSPFHCLTLMTEFTWGNTKVTVNKIYDSLPLKLWSSNNSSADTVTKLQAVREKNRRSILVKRLLLTAFRPPPGTSTYLFLRYREIFPR